MDGNRNIQGIAAIGQRKTRIGAPVVPTDREMVFPGGQITGKMPELLLLKEQAYTN